MFSPFVPIPNLTILDNLFVGEVSLQVKSNTQIAVPPDVIIRSAPADRSAYGIFNRSAILALADFCASQNPLFKRDRWLDYIAGKCGKNGGPVKQTVAA